MKKGVRSLYLDGDAGVTVNISPTGTNLRGVALATVNGSISSVSDVVGNTMVFRAWDL